MSKVSVVHQFLFTREQCLTESEIDCHKAASLWTRLTGWFRTACKEKKKRKKGNNLRKVNPYSFTSYFFDQPIQASNFGLSIKCKNCFTTTIMKCKRPLVVTFGNYNRQVTTTCMGVTTL